MRDPFDPSCASFSLFLDDKWAFGKPETAELNLVLLLWWMRDRINPEQLPEQRVVVEFNFRETRPRCFWLVLDPEDVSVCVKHPGYDIDVLIQAELAALYEVWFGRITFEQAIQEERVEIDSTPAWIRAFPRWFALSPAAEIVRATLVDSGNRRGMQKAYQPDHQLEEAL